MEGVTVLFDPDEESNYCALTSEELIEKSKILSTQLLQSVAGKLPLLEEAGA
jgi:hypothetical protein